MVDNEMYSVVQGESKSELQKFASWFHQDWQVIFPSFHEIGVEIGGKTEWRLLKQVLVPWLCQGTHIYSGSAARKAELHGMRSHAECGIEA